MGLPSGVCPQCGSDKIYVGTGVQALLGDTNNHFVVTREFLGVDKVAWLKRYVCANCYFTETYIADDKSMERILENFEPLNKEKRKNEG